MANKSGYTLIELLIAIALMGLFFYGLFAGLRTALFLITEGKLKTTANALAVEQIERVRSLEYSSVGTYVQSSDCPEYDTANPDCVVGIPAGPIPQSQTITMNNAEYTIEVEINELDDDRDGSGGSDENGVSTDMKSVKVVVSWVGRTTESLELVTTVSPPGVESSAGGGSLRVNVVDEAGDPVSGISVIIRNSTTSPAISQPGTTTTAGSRLLSGLPQGPNYEVLVNLDTSLSVLDSDYTYARTYEVGEVFPYDGSTEAIIAPNPGKLTVDEGLITSITVVIDQSASMELRAQTEPQKNTITAGLLDSSLGMVNTELFGGNLQLEYDPDTTSYAASGTAKTDLLSPTQGTYEWLWFDYQTTGEDSLNTVVVKFYYDDGGVSTLIPEADLPGNNAGFSNTVPINLQSLSANVYPDIAIEFVFSGDSVATPAVTAAELVALRNGSPLENLGLRVFGTDWVGRRASDSEKVWKYDFELTTDASGLDSKDLLAADKYRSIWRSFSGFNEVQTCPRVGTEFSLLPDEAKVIESTWRNSSSSHNTMTVSVQNAFGTQFYPGTLLVLSGDTIDREGLTDGCGQYTFYDMPSGSFNLDISGPSIPLQSQTVNLSGKTIEIIEI